MGKDNPNNPVWRPMFETAEEEEAFEIRLRLKFKDKQREIDEDNACSMEAAVDFWVG